MNWVRPWGLAQRFVPQVGAVSVVRRHLVLSVGSTRHLLFVEKPHDALHRMCLVSFWLAGSALGGSDLINPI